MKEFRTCNNYDMNTDSNNIPLILVQIAIESYN